MFSYASRATFTMKIHCFDRKFLSSASPFAPFTTSISNVPLETHFWYALPSEVKSESLLNQYFELLSPCEKENVLSVREEEPRKRALLARALVRTTIARYQINSKVSPRSLKFRKNAYGKPEVEWQHSDDWHPPPLHFNISHTASLVACGVTTDSLIGIDVEEKQRTIKNNILSFAQRYFSHQEVELLTSILDPEVQRQEFIKLWTLKEAYVKALGRGFSASPFNTFTIRFRATTRGNFHLSGNSSSEVPLAMLLRCHGGNAKFTSIWASEIVVESLDDPTNHTSNWQFALLELAGSHYAAICTKKDSTPEGRGSVPMKLKVWKTIPFVEDKCVSGTDSVVTMGGLT